MRNRLKSILYIVLSLFQCLFSTLSVSVAEHVPVFYTFGDSMVDVGNNYYIQTTLKSEFPNGIDLGNGGNSGRLTNGRTIVDILEQELGAKNFSPPFLAPTTAGDAILSGVNFASSGAGIFPNTGQDLGFGKIPDLDQQINNFEKIRQDTVSLIGISAAKKMLEEAIYFVAIGTNDVKRWESLSQNGTWATLDVYFNALISKFRSQLQRLYEFGARKLLVSGVGLLGCIPNERDTHPSEDGCVAFLNQQIQSFNRRLKKMLADITNRLNGSMFVFVDSYSILDQIIGNYKSYGFKNADTACCGNLGPHKGLLYCSSFTPLCPNRSEYIFWDAFHLTDRANQIVTKYLLDAGPKYVSPMNIRQLLNRTASSVL